MSQIQAFGLKDRARVREVVHRSMENDPCAKYIAKRGQVPQLFDCFMSPCWSRPSRELHLMTNGCESVVFARFHPSEEVIITAAASPMSNCYLLPCSFHTVDLPCRISNLQEHHCLLAATAGPHRPSCCTCIHRVLLL